MKKDIRTEIFNKVFDIVIEKSCDGRIIKESKLKDDLGLDSLDMVELGMDLEEAFDIEIPDEAIDGFVTVEDIVDYIAKATF